MITIAQKAHATAALRAAGFNPNEVRELLAGPKGLRDEFAMAAITGTLPGARVPSDEVATYAGWAYRLADAMLAARSAE